MPELQPLFMHSSHTHACPPSVTWYFTWYNLKMPNSYLEDEAQEFPQSSTMLLSSPPFPMRYNKTQTQLSLNGRHRLYGVYFKLPHRASEVQNLRQSASDETDEKETRSLEVQLFVPWSLTSDSKQVFLVIARTNARVDTCSIHNMHSTFEGTRLSRTHYELRSRYMKSPESLELSWELVAGLVSFLIMSSDELESSGPRPRLRKLMGLGSQRWLWRISSSMRYTQRALDAKTT